ncbi:MAG TPA: PspA/IM30 family protein [Nannocystis exedens]|nr:PspA/IM30 family protein [Nannocystis exedens]
MGLFSRLGTLIRSNINELINKAEDPEKMLNQVLVDMKQQLVEAKKQVAIAIADEKRIKKQHQQALLKAKDWEKKAMLAIRAGDENLARAALQRKAEHDEVASALGEQWEAQKASVDQLKQALRGLDGKIDEAKRKRNILVSRQKRAEAQRTINETLQGINSTSAFDTFERMSDRVTQLEAEAEATAEMGGALMESSLDAQFKALEAGSVDDELEALKQKMALQAPKPAKQIAGDVSEIPPAAPPPSAAPPSEEEVQAAAIDAQLEALKAKLSAD